MPEIAKCSQLSKFPPSNVYSFIRRSFYYNIATWVIIVYDDPNQVFFVDYRISKSSANARGAEIDALLHALFWVTKSGSSHFLVLTDCPHLVELSNGFVDSINWCNYYITFECMNRLKLLNVNINCASRSVNIAAHNLANYAGHLYFAAG